jgi:hypothetical protein
MFITTFLAAYYTSEFYYKPCLMLLRETLLFSVSYRLLYKDSYTAVSVFIKILGL